MYLGDIRLSQTIEWTFTTRNFTTGAPFTLAGTPSLEAYETGSSTPITAGITLTVDYSGVTGLNHVSLVASGANGFVTANDIAVVIAVGTVNSVSVVGETIGLFSIENRSAVMPTVGGRTLDVTATGAAGVDWANVENPSTANNLSATNIDVDQVVASVSGAVASVTARVTANTDQLAGQTVTAAAGVTFPTSVASPTNITAGTITTATNVTTVNGLAAGVITAASIAADAITDAKVASDVTIASVTGAVGSVTGAVGSVTGNVGGNVTGSVGSVAAGGITAASIATGAIDADALATDAVDEIVDGVWDEAIAGHLSAGTTGLALNSAGSAGDPWSTALPGAYGAGTAGHIVGTALPDIAPGSANGLLRGGTNAATSITTALTANLIGNITGNLSGSVGSVTGAVGSVTGAVGSVTGNVGGNVTGTIGGLTTAAKAEVQQEAEDALAAYDGPTNAELTAALAALNNLSAAQVNAEVVDALATDTYAEPAAVPAATASLKDKISFLAVLARNRVTQTATTQTLRNDANSADIATATVSDDGTTFVRAEWQ